MSSVALPVGAAPAAPTPSTATKRTWSVGTPLSLGLVTAFLSVIVLIPLAAVAYRSFAGGWDGFWQAVTHPQALAALRLSLVGSLVVAAVNAVMGTIIAWVLVRDDFPGKGAVNALIDLPFALPTIVAGLTLIALYGSRSPLGINIAYTTVAVILALLFVTLPFVVRAVQPVLEELEYIVPDQTILIENPVAVVTESANPDKAAEFISFLRTAEAQRVFGGKGYRPIVPDILAEFDFPTPGGLFTIADLGGWADVTTRFFDPNNGVVAQILQQ